MVLATPGSRTQLAGWTRAGRRVGSMATVTRKAAVTDAPSNVSLETVSTTSTTPTIPTTDGVTDDVGRHDATADVVVVGAGPGGSAAAAYLAGAGLDVLLLEKAHFPRDKVCGDGLTPRAVRELAQLGVPTREEDGWIRNKGLRIGGGGRRF